MTASRLTAALRECALHARILAQALLETRGWLALDATRVATLADADRRVLDQLAYRFGKLQDTLGERVLPALLDVAQEPLPERATFAEKLQRLERLGAIDGAAQWKALREVRNQIAQEYPDAPEVRAAAVNQFLAGIAVLLNCWETVLSFAGRVAADCLPAEE